MATHLPGVDLPLLLKVVLRHLLQGTFDLQQERGKVFYPQPFGIVEYQRVLQTDSARIVGFEVKPYSKERMQNARDRSC
ncbi:endomembrane family protein 70 [Corchorus olitorius]|uniref:Endomembrane family protein 70 n=1 Tax=Corchorus olitorius TaxID=93759 RepID=A0A1R3KBJ1_9ROSI|nr:endomembrane family protein 70 [Corchorus olitorius]